MTADELIASLDAKFPAWEMWRTADKQWVSRDQHGGQTHMSASMTDCLTSLLYYVPLPVVPRQPTLLTLDLFVDRKYWAYWSLRYDEREHSFHYKTKKEAMRCAEQECERASKRCAEWADKYSELVARGKEGIDYRWED